MGHFNEIPPRAGVALVTLTLCISCNTSLDAVCGDWEPQEEVLMCGIGRFDEARLTLACDGTFVSQGRLTDVEGRQTNVGSHGTYSLQGDWIVFRHTGDEAGLEERARFDGTRGTLETSVICGGSVIPIKADSD